MTQMTRTPLHREEDDEFLGFVAQDVTGWQAQTIFGYPIARVETKQDAESTLREKGLSYLTGVWHYFDTDDRAWFPCVIIEAYENRVAVDRTNELGYLDPDDRKRVVIEYPSEDNLVKSA